MRKFFVSFIRNSELDSERLGRFGSDIVNLYEEEYQDAGDGNIAIGLRKWLGYDVTIINFWEIYDKT